VETLSIVGGAVVPLIEIENLACPGDGVADTDPCRLGASPQLQVFWPVVVSNTVTVMYRLTRQEIPSQDLVHHEDMFEHVTDAAGGPGMRGNPPHDVSGLVPGLPTLPVAI
jgi:hypothetical protein